MNKEKKEKVCVINLGCVRNLVDAQEITGRLVRDGHSIVDLEQAESVILNTCSFIEDAKKESIDAILDLIELKRQGKIKKVVVAGCLAERYAEILPKEFNELDALIGVPEFKKDTVPPYVYLTPSHYAYVKICESCYNHCNFCAIPKIKGRFASRAIEAVVGEMKALDEKGVKEVMIIGQDITAYGMDLYHELSLVELLKEILKATKNIEWMRLLYTYPAHVTDELIDLMAKEERLCKYIDLPLQHISDNLLESMNRNITTQQTRELIAKIRSRMPQGCLRTTFIVGLPGETEENFAEMVDFVREVKFEKLGVLSYSREEDTKAFNMKDQVPRSTKEKRFKVLMEEQKKISQEIQESLLGTPQKVLIDEKDSEQKDVYLGRTELDAPDVDGVVFVHSRKALKPGDFVKVKITDTLEYDLVGEEQ
ncbi:MAG: 30S ribosomal protein S12 methylthiotransferase RimO [Candidatus Omnitrophica bacterium]|nr:30S ribosomal protein S12 methylthiotransferase RimO [Candidatus Omnitrophota bacterium]